jgi:hypothetical protein
MYFFSHKKPSRMPIVTYCVFRHMAPVCLFELRRKQDILAPGDPTATLSPNYLSTTMWKQRSQTSTRMQICLDLVHLPHSCAIFAICAQWEPRPSYSCHGCNTFELKVFARERGSCVLITVHQIYINASSCAVKISRDS